MDIQEQDEIAVAGEAPRTPFDWLSRDPAEVDAYITDPLCGFSRKPGSEASFARVSARLKDPINQDLALLTPLTDRYEAAGLNDLTVKIYPGGRHEMLNETNRDQVVADLLAWLKRVAGL